MKLLLLLLLLLLSLLLSLLLEALSHSPTAKCKCQRSESAVDLVLSIISIAAIYHP